MRIGSARGGSANRPVVEAPSGSQIRNGTRGVSGTKGVVQQQEIVQFDHIPVASIEKPGSVIEALDSTNLQ